MDRTDLWKTYGSLSVFQKPCCLVKNDSDGNLKACSDVLNQLKQIRSPLNVIAITGPYRTGKSYLLNYLARERKGFLLGSTIEATTKGIWVWCRPHPLPERQDEVFLLLDNGGLGNAEKGDEGNDNWIFALSVLLSSSLVYNCMNTVVQDVITKLHYVTELTTRIKARDTSDKKDGGEFYKFFPNFVLILRDITLSLENGGKRITSDQYFLDSLQLKEGKDNKTEEYNKPRQCIRHFFGEKKCFLFPSPVNDGEKLRDLEKLPDSELDDKFLQEAEKFRSYIYQESFPKTADGQPIHGRMFCTLLEIYLKVIQSGEVLCVEDAVKNMADRENAEAFEDSFNFYETHMKELSQKSIHNEEELLKAHTDCSDKALERFMSLSTLDERHKFQKQLKEKIRQKYENICSGSDWDLRGSDSEIGQQIKLTQTLTEPLTTIPIKKKRTMKQRHECERQEAGDLNIRISESTSAKQSSSKSKQIFDEFENALHELYQLKQKLEQEKENRIKEKERRLEKRDEELKRSNDSIIDEQCRELRGEIEKERNELKEIKEGDCSYGKYLRKEGYALLEMIFQRLPFWTLDALNVHKTVLAVANIVGGVSVSETVLLHVNDEEHERGSEVKKEYEEKTDTEPAGKDLFYSGQKNDKEQENGNEVKKELQRKKDDLRSSDRRMEIHEIILEEFCKEKLLVFLSVRKTDSDLTNLLQVILQKNNMEALCVMMAYINKKWKEDFNDNTISVWLGFDHRGGKTEEMVLVCFHSALTLSKFSKYLGLPMIYRRFDETEMEPLENRLQDKYRTVSFNRKDADNIKRLINDHGENLFKLHSNLEAVAASSVKSTKSGIIMKTSILLYCRLKGVIPYGEKSFPVQLKVDEQLYPTDIREGFFSLGMNPDQRLPSDPHPHFVNKPLRMGCSIGPKGLDVAGTLGPFVRFGANDIGFLTCAHVLGINSSSSQTKVVQPSNIESGLPVDDRICGTFVRETFDPFANIGVDAALVCIDQTKRKVDAHSFVWMGSNQPQKTGMFKGNSPSFKDGMVITKPDLQNLEGRRDVCKFGRSTGLTHGVLVLENSMLRVHNASLSLPNEMPLPNGYTHNTFIMKRQFLIQNIGTDPFFSSGDSGAGVYAVKGHQHGESKLALIGIAIGSITSGECAMTPIGRVLEALGLNESNIITEEDMETDP